MRSALTFVLFTIITRRPLSRAEDDFRPTPIPLNYWQFEYQDARDARSANYETEAPTASLPAHYWEDALRHSVYLTLVRDKIDQLIAKGDFISPNSSPGSNVTRDDDDHDLWDKIKRAPFERVESEEPGPFGDVITMSKGRLIENNGGFKFTEDERNKEKCDNHTCTDGVKAFWSVKRIRQKDAEPGRYHYELTFSVLTKEIPKKVKRPYDNPTRTFTVRESSPATIIDKPLEHQKQEPILPAQTPRPDRAIWFHKNIIPTQRYQARQYQQNGLDRLFSSLFTDDDYEVVRYKSKPPQQQQQTYVPQTYTQYSKISYVGAPSDQHQQKRLMPYPYKPHSIKYSRPPIPQPPMPHPHHYLDTDAIGVVSAPYNVPNYHTSAPYNLPEHKYSQPPGKPLKPGRPPVLPTPLPPYPTKPNSTFETSTKVVADDSRSTGSVVSSTPAPVPEIVTGYTPSEGNNGWPSSPHEDERPPPLQQTYQTYEKPIYGKTKPNTQVKVNYFPEHVRPPVYNAPPGVFVTMDKKPFKPMPPLRLVQTKPVKTPKPVDFRPSPQVLDIQQFAEPDPLKDSFRPITGNYENSSAETEHVTKAETEKQKGAVIENSKPVENVRKHHRKPVKKHHKHSQIQAFISTATPDIITAKTSSEEEKDTIEWANILGAFSKTTPMAAAERDRPKDAETTTTPVSTTITAKATTRRTTTTTTETPTTTTTTAPPKRTRPPPKFTKPPKVKKHKRVTSTTTKAPEREKFTPKRPAYDLTPQASSAAASKSSTKWTPSSTSTTSTSTRPSTTTTAKTTTTTTEAPTTVSSTAQPLSTTKTKSKNRYRQSTLMQKGTSVNHDKWSIMSLNDSKIRTIIPPTGNFPPRRKGSNFQGYYTSSTAAAYDEEEEDYEEIPSSSITPKLSSTTEAIIASTRVEIQAASVAKTTQPTYEETADQYETVSERQEPHEDEDSDEEDDENERTEEDDQEQEQDTKDNNEFMFYPRSTTSPSDRTNEIADNEDPLATEQTVIASPHSVPKNKTKCKKKPTTTTEEPEDFGVEEKKPTTPSTTTSSHSEDEATPDFLDELFGGFTFDEPQELPTNVNKSSAKPELEDPEEEESENHESYAKLEDKDFEDFLDELEDKDGSESSNEDSFYSEDEKDTQESNYDDEEEKESKRGSDDDVFEHSPFSLLELMAME